MILTQLNPPAGPPPPPPGLEINSGLLILIIVAITYGIFTIIKIKKLKKI